MHRSRWWMNKWTDSDTSVSGGTIYRHWRMCFERLLQAFARWQPGILLIVIHNRYSFAANDTLIHCLSSSDSTVHPEKSASWELPRNSFLTCFHSYRNLYYLEFLYILIFLNNFNLTPLTLIGTRFSPHVKNQGGGVKTPQRKICNISGSLTSCYNIGWIATGQCCLGDRSYLEDQWWE